MAAMFLALSAIAFSGCQSTPAKRIAKDQAVFAAMPAEAQAKIKNGQIAIGFTETQVVLAKGKPDRIGSRTTAAGEEIVWTYEQRASGLGLGLGIGGGSGGLGGGVGVSTGGRSREVSMRVAFSGGVVSAIENHE